MPFLIFPWRAANAETLDIEQGKLAQHIAYKTYGASHLFEFVAMICATVVISIGFFLCCNFAYKKLAKRRECAAEKSRS